MTEPDTMPDVVRRLREARAATKPPPPDVSEIEARVARLNARWDAEHREYQKKYREEHVDDEAEAEPPARRTRQRKPSIASAIRQARKAGERGAVRVTLPDGTTIISNEHEPTTTGNGACNGVSEWDTL
jgi:hypothetical protein